MDDREGTMKCSDAVRRLWDYLDKTVSPEESERIEQHLSFCRRCCGELEFAKELRAFLAKRAVEEIPPDVKERLDGFVGELER
jgi:anti-sigma factor (TIGR02949 family)